MSDPVHYIEGGPYRYLLTRRYVFASGIRGCTAGGNDYVFVDEHGVVTVEANYAWDGASGPVFQTEDSVRGTLRHDALYQLLRMKWMPMTARLQADALMYTTLVEDGMPRWRAALWFLAVRLLGQHSISK